MTIQFQSEALTKELVRAGSVSGSAGEQRFPDVLLGILGRIPYIY